MATRAPVLWRAELQTVQSAFCPAFFPLSLSPSSFYEFCVFCFFVHRADGAALLSSGLASLPLSFFFLSFFPNKFFSLILWVLRYNQFCTLSFVIFVFSPPSILNQYQHCNTITTIQTLDHFSCGQDYMPVDSTHSLLALSFANTSSV